MRNSRIRRNRKAKGGACQCWIRSLLISSAVLFFLVASSLSYCTEYKFMTFNIHHGAGPSPAPYDLSRTIQVINDSGCQVAGLQEVDNSYSSRSNYDYQPQLISAGTSMNYFYGPNIGTRYGNCLLADPPILNPANHSLPNPESTEPRGVIHAQIELAGMTLHVLDTHFSAYSETTNRTQQTQWLKNFTDGLSGSIVIMGDFNSTASSELGPLFSDAKLVSTRATLGLSESIDDIIVSSNLVPTIVSGGNISTTASDHDPYWVILDLPESSSARFWEIYR